MDATTPTGSRRTIEVWPSRYSVTARPSGTRQAPAKKRNRSEETAISSIAAWVGLPVWRDSRRPSSSALASRMSAILSSARLRVWGVVSDQRLERVRRRVDGPVDVLLARTPGRARRLHVGRRVLDDERLAGRGVDPLAADELLVRLHGHGAGGLHGRRRAQLPVVRSMCPRLCATPGRRSTRGPRRATAGRPGGRPGRGGRARGGHGRAGLGGTGARGQRHGPGGAASRAGSDRYQRGWW